MAHSLHDLFRILITRSPELTPLTQLAIMPQSSRLNFAHSKVRLHPEHALKMKQSTGPKSRALSFLSSTGRPAET
jgi:hypothetical protein